MKHNILIHLIVFYYFLISDLECNSNFDDNLEINLHFEPSQIWESCNLVSMTIVNSNETINLIPVNQKIITNDSGSSINNVADSGQRSCLYQQEGTNRTRIVAINVHNDTLNGFLSFDNVNYFADEILLLHQSSQTIRMFIWTNETSSNVPGVCGVPTNPNSPQSISEQASSVVDNVDNVNNTIDNYYVELYLVADKDFYVTHGGNSVNRMYEIMNYVNAVYRAQGIHILLVAVEVWSDKNRITVTSNYSLLLDNLRVWRTTLSKQHDNLHMINRYGYDRGVIGLAFVNGMCHYEYSVGMSADYTPANSIATAMTIAHEMGHNFGLNHDNSPCKCPATNCIMSAYSSLGANPLQWSDCSLNTLQLNLKSGSSSYCLNNLPATITNSTMEQKCGNGIVDDGEDCDSGLLDLGSSKCCNKTTCKFKNQAVCSSGRCCDKTTCQFLSAGINCRIAKDECDLNETCSGNSENCPDDSYKMNGESCDNDQGTCFDGHCGSHDKQCKLLYGPLSSKATDDCYLRNVFPPTFKTGYCNYRLYSTSRDYYYYTLVGCSTNDYLCGTLQCAGGSVPLWPSVETYYSSSNCKHLFFNVNMTGLRDPGFVPNGARCGSSKVCQNSVCVQMNETTPTNATTTPTTNSTASVTTIATLIASATIPSTATATADKTTTPTRTSTTPATATRTAVVTLTPTTTTTTNATVTTTKTNFFETSTTSTSTTSCLSSNCENGGSCQFSPTNCNGQSSCCNCAIDYLPPFCKILANQSFAFSFTINKTYNIKLADSSSDDFKTASDSICNLIKDSYRRKNILIICIVVEIRAGSWIPNVIVKGSSSTVTRNISNLQAQLLDECNNNNNNNNLQSLCSSLKLETLIENPSLYNVCPTGLPSSATTCSSYSQCQGDNNNAAFYNCTCRIGFRDEFTGNKTELLGRNCTEICTTSLCKNGGICYERKGNAATCLCPDGYSGAKCDSVDNGKSTKIIIIVCVVVGSLLIIGIIVLVYCVIKAQRKKATYYL